MEQEYTPTRQPEKSQENTEKSELRELQERVLGSQAVRMVVRVMNLEGHSGVSERHEDGAVTYTVDNEQYPDQGDWAFLDADQAFDAAVTRAYPRNLHNVHLVEAPDGAIVEPYPDDMPGVGYIENSATAHAIPVPEAIINENIDRVNAGLPPFTTEEVRARMRMRGVE